MNNIIQFILSFALFLLSAGYIHVEMHENKHAPSRRTYGMFAISVIVAFVAFADMLQTILTGGLR